MLTPLLDCYQVAHYLNVSHETVYLMIRRGDIVCVHVGVRAVRIRREDLMRYVRQQLECRGRTQGPD